MANIDNQMADLNSKMSVLSEESVLPFGHYKGQSIEDIPNFYLEWMLTENILEDKSCYNYLLKPVEKEMEYRKANSIFIHAE